MDSVEKRKYVTVTYWSLAKQILEKLAKEYRLPLPEFRIGDSSDMCDCVGMYETFPCPTILIDKSILKDPVETCATIRHEFAHYWQDYVGLPSSERSAKRFEKPSNQLALPHNQRMLLAWMEISL